MPFQPNPEQHKGLFLLLQAVKQMPTESQTHLLSIDPSDVLPGLSSEHSNAAKASSTIPEGSSSSTSKSDFAQDANMGSYLPPAEPARLTSVAPGIDSDRCTAAAGPSKDAREEDEHVEAAVSTVAATPPLLTDATSTHATPTDATPTDATSTDAVPTDAIPTDATSNDATPTDATPTPVPDAAPASGFAGGGNEVSIGAGIATSPLYQTTAPSAAIASSNSSTSAINFHKGATADIHKGINGDCSIAAIDVNASSSADVISSPSTAVLVPSSNGADCLAVPAQPVANAEGTISAHYHKQQQQHASKQGQHLGCLVRGVHRGEGEWAAH